MLNTAPGSRLLSSRSSKGATTFGGYSQPSTPFATISKVTDGLYVCGVLALNEAKIKQLGVTCIVNCAAELPCIQVPGVQTIKVGVDDVPSAPLYVHFDKIADRINDVKQSGGKTLVHCVAGMSRSPTLCLAYLIKHEGMSAQRALDHVVLRRPIVQPNPGFWRQIVDFERRVRGAAGSVVARTLSSRRVLAPATQSKAPISIVALRSPSLVRSFTSWATTYSKDFGSTSSLGLMRR